MKQSNNLTMNQGFTLTELLVVIVIIGILSSVLFLGRTKTEEKLALQRSAYRLVQDLREVQEMAMGAGEVDCGVEKTHSFGICFDLNSSLTSYYLFADCGPDADKTYNGNDKLLREVNLEKKVQIQGISPSSLNALNVVFSPPDPATYINQEEWRTDEGVITLSLESDPNQQKTVKINSAGRIEIE